MLHDNTMAILRGLNAVQPQDKTTEEVVARLDALALAHDMAPKELAGIIKKQPILFALYQGILPTYVERVATLQRTTEKTHTTTPLQSGLTKPSRRPIDSIQTT